METGQLVEARQTLLGGLGGVLLFMNRGDSSASAAPSKPSAVRVEPWLSVGAAGMRGSF
jgi:hypothetical protein